MNRLIAAQETEDMIKIFCAVLLPVMMIACGQGSTVESREEKQQVFPERTNPNPNPVASFSEKVTGEMGDLNHWKFEVALYETAKTFTYRLQVKYAELDITDSLQLPDLGLAPNPSLQKGKEDYSCIVGFLDDKNAFREYKLVRVTEGNVHITPLKYYGVQRGKK